MKLRESKLLDFERVEWKGCCGEIEGLLLGILRVGQEGRGWYRPHECAAEEDCVDEGLN
jgi:hypothetical protein